MAKEIGKRERRRGSTVKSFCGGTFFGFLLCLALIGGTVLFAYYKVSPKWLNDKFNTSIDLGTEELNNLTIKEAVNHAIGLSQNIDSYTLNNLKTDFGVDIGNSFKGIDISDLKDVPLSKLSAELQSTLTSISAAELEKELVNFSGDIQNVLSSSFTYYYNDEKLYKEFDGVVYNGQVLDGEFKYSYLEESNQIEIKGVKFNIENNKVTIPLKYLPIVTALSSFSDLKIADVMGLSFDGVSYYNDVNNNDVKDLGEDISVVLNSIAGVTVGGLVDKVEELKLADVFSSTDLAMPIFKLLGNNVGEILVEEVADKLQKAISNSTIIKLSDVKIINLDDEEKAKLYNLITFDGETRILGSLTITEFVEYALTIIP